MISESLMERYELCKERLSEISEEWKGRKSYEAYFHKISSFLLLLAEQYEFIQSKECFLCEIAVLKEKNVALYREYLPGNYEKSFLNPTYAKKELAGELYPYLAAAYAEIASLIPLVYEGKLSYLVRGMEFILLMFSSFASAREEGVLPGAQEIKELLYYYVSDYTADAYEDKIKDLVCAEDSLITTLIEKCGMGDDRYLYLTGEYITENECRMRAYLQKLSDEEIHKMAFTYTEGYRIGFEVTNKDISKKKTVDIRWRIGFERMVQKAIEEFEKIGLKPTCHRGRHSLLSGRGMVRNGFYGAIPNMQFDFDHKDDQALFLDKRLLQVRLESLKKAYENHKEEAAVFGGPAVIDTFGEDMPNLLTNPDAPVLSKAQRELIVEHTALAGKLQNEYIKGEERSFTIIAFPTPEIGERFPEIFEEIMKINTLDYMKYRTLQQVIIDALDRGKYVIVKGMKGNRTNMKVSLHPLTDAAKQTNFENCVADVNIPVGEVFTSPVLAGTEGVLHVSRVYLEGLLYKDLEISFQDGCVTDYSCQNFDTREENRKFISENVLFNHETLPIGEFAIGTNTTAFVAARKYGIEDKLPILIAEKTGPHFAVGDTCYSQCEDVVVYNPDGKEIIAKDNEISALRKEDYSKAYFNCHTDITIPYDELGEISVVTADEEVITVIEDGRFVLPGTEWLNQAFET